MIRQSPALRTLVGQVTIHLGSRFLLCLGFFEMRLKCFATLAFTLIAASIAQVASPQATPATQPPEVAPLPDLAIPPNADQAKLESLIEAAKQIKPASPDHFKAMQIAIRDASKQLMLVVKDKSAPRYQQAQLDAMSASISLSTFFGDEARDKVIVQLKDMLKERKQLSIADVQMAIFAGANLELQPNKTPAKEVYQLVDELLTDDKREEMQSMRLHLQSAVRRLELLGSNFEIDATTVDKKPVKLQQYAGKYVIVDFFASWCKPCLSEVPRLKKHFATYKNRGLEIIAISLDEDNDALSHYLKSAELPWPVIHDNSEDLTQRLQMKYGISALPTVLLLNKEGTVISLEARGAELDRLMEMLFEAPTLADPPPQEKKSAAAPTVTNQPPASNPTTKTTVTPKPGASAK
jgi:thiol-disulfide isomerase/thioredoxin